MKWTFQLVTMLSMCALTGAARGALPAIDALRDDRPDPMADAKAVVVAGSARFTVLSDRLVRMEWSPDGTFEDRASQVVINRRLPVPSYTKSEDTDLRGAGTALSEKSVNGKPVVVIRADRVEIRYRPDGKPFSEDNLVVRCRVGGGGADKWWEGTPPFSQCSNLGGTVRTLDGVSGACPLPDGLLNRCGWTYLDDSRTLLFDESEWPWATPRRQPDAIDAYLLIYGSDYPAALAEFTKIAGRIPLPPRYVFGTWWSRYWAYSDAQLRQLVLEFRQHEVPLDVLVIDMDWHLDGWTGYTWNPEYFPDPEGSLKWVHSQGLKATLNLHPADGVGKHEAAFGDMCKALGLNPDEIDRIPFDCTDRRFVDAYFKHLHHPLEKMGVDFWWMDWQQGTNTKLPGLDPLWWLNYLHWTDMERRASQTGRRPLIFSRWGGLGNHRYQVGFSGDTFCDWPSLAFQPYFTATAGNVGYAYWSHDIGGHQPGPVEPELYTRWIQWGALSPILRTHTTKNPDAERRIWKFPEAYFHAARKAFVLRYELIPYLYTTARTCYDIALPLCRPLYYHWPEHEAAYARKGQYLLGDDLLVAPVVEPGDVNSGCAMTEVWIPPGQWIHWYTGRLYEGPRVVAQVTPLDEIPLFARAGAIVPMAKDRAPGSEGDDGRRFPPAERPLETLVLNIFPADRSEGRLYEDDGVSDGYRRGEHAWTRITQEWADGRRVITIEPPEGSYRGMPEQRGYVLRVFDRSPAIYEVEVNGRLLNATAGEDDSGRSYWWYDARIMGPSVHIAPMPIGERIRVVIGETAAMREEAVGLDGFRGMMSALCHANGIARNVLLGGAYGCDRQEWVFSLHPTGASQAVELWKDAWGMNMAGIRAMELSAEDERRALMRMLGLFCKLSVEPIDEGLSETAYVPQLRARLKLSTVLPLPLLKNVLFDVSLRCDGNWSVRTEQNTGSTEPQQAWRVHGITEDKPFVAGWRLAPKDEPGTVVLQGEIVLHDDERPLRIPLQTVVLPSINAWWVLGPFDAPFNEALDRVFPPEEKIDLRGRYKGKGDLSIEWKQVMRRIRPGDDLTDEFFMNFTDVFGGRVYEAVVYAYTLLDSPEEMDATLAIGSDDGVAVWLNGEKVHHRSVGRPYASKQDRVPVRLKKGENALLIKVNQGGGDWGLGVHVETIDGRPLTQVKARLPEE